MSPHTGNNGTNGGTLSKVEQAVQAFDNGDGFSCAQAILSTYAGQFDVDREMALKIATGFGGGMGRMGETCGAVSASFMLFGLRSGRTTVEDKQAKEDTYNLVLEFVRRFKEHNGTIVCKELLGHDISTPEGREAANESGAYAEICPKLVRNAAEILEELL
jgi:C_GCAxxG_C_C family probable redox protein